jgi:hypothetical protein
MTPLKPRRKAQFQDTTNVPDEDAGPGKRARKSTRAGSSASTPLASPAVTGGQPLDGAARLPYEASEVARKALAKQMAITCLPVPGADVITALVEQLSLGFFPYHDRQLEAVLLREDVKALLDGPLRKLVEKQGSADGMRPLLEAGPANEVEKKLPLFRELRKHTLAAAYRAAKACLQALAEQVAKGVQLTTAALQLQLDCAKALKQARETSFGREVLGSPPEGPSDEQAPHTDGQMLSVILALLGPRPPPLVVCRDDRQREQRTVAELGAILRRHDPGWEVRHVECTLGQQRLQLTGALLSDTPRLASMGPIMQPGSLVLVAKDTPHAGSMVPQRCLSEFIGLCGEKEYSGSDNKPCFHVAALAGADRTCARLLMKDEARMPSFLARYPELEGKKMKAVQKKSRAMAAARTAAEAASALEPGSKAASAAWRAAKAKERQYLAVAAELGTALRANTAHVEAQAITSANGRTRASK